MEGSERSQWNLLSSAEALFFAVAHDGDLAAPQHSSASILQIQDESSVLVDAEDGSELRKHGDQRSEARLAHVAAAGVQLRAAAYVVPMRDDRELQPVGAEEVQALVPVQLHAGLVDLIDR
jgi:hypothetical protein